MTGRPVSVVVVSRGRPRSLVRCLRGLEQQFHDPMEVVVVPDPAGAEAVAAAGLATRVKMQVFDRANISEARNIGIDLSAGEIVAFIDDDAVAEPTWAGTLAAAFDDPEVAAAGGFVRGRNGLSFQWQARAVDGSGRHRELLTEGDAPQTPLLLPGEALRTEGTNMALRRDVLVQMGGFDPAFAFYMDETDLNLRLADAGLRTVTVPLAQVHHGYAESDRRRADRMPTDLSRLGESTARFLAKHRARDAGAVLDEVRAEQRRRLVTHMVAGRCMPGDVARLMRGLESGIAAGLAGHPAPIPMLSRTPPAFRRFGIPPTGSEVIAGRLWSIRRLRARARAARAEGKVATLMAFSRTSRFHRVAFDESGIWIHRGGIHGRADRDEFPLKVATLGDRVAAEVVRFAALRRIGGE